MNTKFVLSTNPSWLRLCDLDLSTFTNLVWSIRRECGHDVSVTILRGQKMRDWQSLFNEISASLQFPYYFGDNLNAFDECIVDLEWLNVQGFALFITDADCVLSNCETEDFDRFFKHLDTAASQWRKPIADGQPWDRDAKPFNIILQTGTKNLKTSNGAVAIDQC